MPERHCCPLLSAIKAKSAYQQAVAGDSRVADHTSSFLNEARLNYHVIWLAQAGIHLHKEEA